MIAELAIALCLLVLPPSSTEAAGVDGFTEPYRAIDVAAAEPGVVTAVKVREGDSVKRGQVLATLDIEVLEASLKVAEAGKQAQGVLKAALARLQLKQERCTRLQELHAQGHASPQELAVATTELAIAQADVLAAEEDQLLKQHEYARIQAQIERRLVRSPIDGIVTRVHKEEAEYVSSTDPHIATVVQCDQLRAFFPVPAAWARRLATGQKVEVAFDELPTPAEATVEFVSPVIDPESGNVHVKVLIDNSKAHYRSGTPCSLQLPTITISRSHEPNVER